MREAIINLTDEEVEAMGYGELVSLCRDAGLREVELLEDDGRGGVTQIEVEDPLDEDKLDDIDSVEDWDFISERDDSYFYLLEVEALEMPETAAVDHDDLVGMCDPTVSDRGMLLSLVGSQEAIRNMLRNFEEAGIVPDLHRLCEYEGGQGTLDALTDRQLEVLKTAYNMGFYDVPREASIEDIAAEVGLNSGTVSEHLQRAERNILSQQFMAEG
jgi:predicted DNA binding protein